MYGFSVGCQNLQLLGSGTSLNGDEVLDPPVDVQLVLLYQNPEQELCNAAAHGHAQFVRCELLNKGAE